jgi:hypothetical protein
MRKLLLIGLTFLTLQVLGQDKYNFIHFNKLTEVEGTEYVIARIENWGKMEGLKSRYLLFINTETGQSNQVDFRKESYFEKIEQVKIDSFRTNDLSHNHLFLYN